tara:strand:- start:2545 stop:2883 length:339 start_codon:yes stop_codon:yes gene_type:complete
MKTHVIGSYGATGTGASTPVYSLQLNELDNYNKNNIGVFNVVSATAGTYSLQGCHRADGGNNEWVDLATGVTTAAGSATVGGSGGKTVALMPFMRLMVTAASASVTTGYVHQ